jgi:acetyl esterase/lipase
LQAADEALTGLPPHYITVSELDPLRDEGLMYSKRLLAAGVTVKAETNMGVSHAAALIFRQAVPEDHTQMVSSIASFAKRVAAKRSIEHQNGELS